MCSQVLTGYGMSTASPLELSSAATTERWAFTQTTAAAQLPSAAPRSSQRANTSGKSRWPLLSMELTWWVAVAWIMLKLLHTSSGLKIHLKVSQPLLVMMDIEKYCTLSSTDLQQLESCALLTICPVFHYFICVDGGDWNFRGEPG